MAKVSVLEELAQKGVDIGGVVDRVVENPEQIAELIEALRIEKRAVKFSYEKVLRLVSERQPELVYPYFDFFVDLCQCDNSFLKWGAVVTVANLTAVDAEKKLEAVFERYYAPISGPAMVTAANIVGSSGKIARSRPELTERITYEILKVERATYEARGRPSPECRNVVIGHAIEAFDELFDQLQDKGAVLKFVKRQLKNTRKQVARKAEGFLRKHAD